MMNVNTIVVGRKLSSQSGSSQLSIDNNNRSFSQNNSRRGSLMKVHRILSAIGNKRVVLSKFWNISKLDKILLNIIDYSMVQ